MSFNVSSENMIHYNNNTNNNTNNNIIDTTGISTGHGNIDIVMNNSNNNSNNPEFVSSYDGSFNNVSSPGANPPISFRRSSMTSEDCEPNFQNSSVNNNATNSNFSNNSSQFVNNNFSQFDSYKANSMDPACPLSSSARLISRNAVNNNNNTTNGNGFSSYKASNINSFNNPLARASYNAPSVVSSSYSSSMNSSALLQPSNNNKFVNSSNTTNSNGFVDVSHHSLSFKPRLSSSFASAKVTITNANSTTTSALNNSYDNAENYNNNESHPREQPQQPEKDHQQRETADSNFNHYDISQIKNSAENYSIAREIYSGRLRSVNGICVDSKGEEHLNIVDYPTEELLKMLSSLLEKIVDANDILHPENKNHGENGNDENNRSSSSLMDEDHERFVANVLAFHGKNVPGIPIYSYFLRILKYCPLANDIFLSLLVYFDRIAKRTNNKEITTSSSSNDGTNPAGNNKDQQLFVMDSFNIHRLIIAGITVSSKVLSDVFYKNSRYARVGGLPLEELNHIELQFILLTDLKLLIQPDELQRYADLLLKFWRREEIKHHQQHAMDSEMS